MKLAYVRARPSRVYTANKSGVLPQRMALLQPDAAKAFNDMVAASVGQMTFTDVYRSVLYQIDCIKGATPVKRKLFAPPTKSGHNFGLSIDVDIDETLENFSRVPELAVHGKSRDALAAWMKQFGWDGISTERWHFDFRRPYALVTEKIAALYGKGFALDGLELQRCLNALLPDAKLVEDGVVGSRTKAAVERARTVLCLDQGQGADAWFQRVLAGATARVEVIRS